jgi:hypothetical protein
VEGKPVVSARQGLHAQASAVVSSWSRIYEKQARPSLSRRRRVPRQHNERGRLSGVACARSTWISGSVVC